MNKTVVMHLRDHMFEIAADQKLRKQFNLEYWGDKISMHDYNEPELECGFSGCFLGWAAHAQWLAPFGLHLVLLSSAVPGSTTFAAHRQVFIGVEREGSEPRFHQFAQDSGRDGMIVHKGISAVAYLMGIKSKTLNYIIYSEHYDETPGAHDVAFKLNSLLTMGEEAFAEQCQQEEREREPQEDEAEA